MVINGYNIIGELNHEDSGFSEWGFCEKNGKTYFIKAFLAPIYPYNDDKLTEKQRQRKIDECLAFEKELTHLYQVIAKASDGNIVRIEEFFRCNSKYYIVTEKVEHSKMTVEEISRLPYPTKKFICKVVAHALLRLHDEGFIHADIKPNNVLIKADESRGIYTAKIIDFDCGFFGTEPPAPGEELNGDPIYFAPEMVMFMMEEDVALSCKIDVFSLGVLFHQYMTGKQPIYDTTSYDYIAEAILDDAEVTVDPSIPEEFAEILRGMLLKEPFQRISLREVYEILSFGRRITQSTEPVPEQTELEDATHYEDYMKAQEIPSAVSAKFKIYKGNK